MKRLCQHSVLNIFCTYCQPTTICEPGLSKLSCMYFFCKCLSLHQSLQQKERKHSGWSALLVKAVAKRGSLLTHSSTEVPEQVHSGVKVVHLTTHSKIIISTAGALVYRLQSKAYPPSTQTFMQKITS